MMRPSQPISGPHWVPSSWEGLRQTDARGVEWRVSRVEAFGRVLHWETESGRVARTEATPDHPEYPSDAVVLERQRRKARAEKASRL
jgi:hypothetical protein